MKNGSNHGVERVTVTSGSILDLAKRLTEEERAVALTTLQGQPVLAAMPWELYESIVEAMETMGNAEMAATLRRGAEGSEDDHTGSGDASKKKSFAEATWGMRPVSDETFNLVMNEPGCLEV